MPLEIHHPKLSHDGGDLCVEIPISDHEPIELRVRGGGPDAEPSPQQLGDLCLTLALMPAMRLGEELVIEAPVSPKLLRNADTLQDIFARWFRDIDPAFTKVAVRAQAGEADPTPPGERKKGRGCFFSGGVDSLHSVKENRDQLSHLIFVHGFDIPAGDTGQATLVRDQLETAAAAIGLPVIDIWTDLRGFTDQHCYWGHHYFGAALAVVAHLLAPQLERVFIPGSCAYDMLQPWGSHVLSDPLWSSDGLEIIHHGAAATRMDKVEAIADWEIAQRHLRVCWEGPPGSYNCGRCEKCTRTQAAIRATGKVDEFAVFEAPLDLEILAGQRAPHPAFVPMIEDMLEFARERDSDPELIAALDESARGTRAELAIKGFANHNNDMLATGNWQRLLPKVRNKLFRSLSESDPEWFVGRLEKILPEQRQAIVELLHRKDRKWLAKAVRSLKKK